jgi:hypothetical protein
MRPAAAHPCDPSGKQDHRSDTKNTQNGEHKRAVFAGDWIVLAAEQNQLLDHRPALPFRRPDDRASELFRIEIHPKEITGNFALRRQDNKAAGMRIFVRDRVEFEAKSSLI